MGGGTNTSAEVLLPTMTLSSLLRRAAKCLWARALRLWTPGKALPCICAGAVALHPTQRALPSGHSARALPLHSVSALPPDTRPTGAALWIPGRALPLHPAQALRPAPGEAKEAVPFSLARHLASSWRLSSISMKNAVFWCVLPSRSAAVPSGRCHFTEKTAVLGDRSISEKIEHLAGVFGLRLCRDWRGRRDRHHRHVLHGMQADVSLQGWGNLGT